MVGGDRRHVVAVDDAAERELVRRLKQTKVIIEAVKTVGLAIIYNKSLLFILLLLFYFLFLPFFILSSVILLCGTAFRVKMNANQTQFTLSRFVSQTFSLQSVPLDTNRPLSSGYH